MKIVPFVIPLDTYVDIIGTSESIINQFIQYILEGKAVFMDLVAILKFIQI